MLLQDPMRCILVIDSNGLASFLCLLLSLLLAPADLEGFLFLYFHRVPWALLELQDSQVLPEPRYDIYSAPSGTDAQRNVFKPSNALAVQ